MLDPATLARHYSRFGVAGRTALTGHSHQAWPDVGLEAQHRAWLDAAQLWDDKWPRAFEQADLVRRAYSRWLGEDPDSASAGVVTLGASTHDLLVRLLSALPLAERPRVVTTDGEFRSARRQLARLAEVGLDVVSLPAHPVADLAARLAAAIDDRTALVLVSAVLYETAEIVPNLGEVAAAGRRHGAAVCVDTYHALGAVDWTLAAHDLDDAYAVGGGYKYLQFGEGAAFLRWPRGTSLRPVITGWFAEFGELSGPAGATVGYGEGPERFAGATYDPTSHYRAAAVAQFFVDQGMTAAALRARSLRQVGRLREGVVALDADPALLTVAVPGDPQAVGGFLAVRSPHAGRLGHGLRTRGVTSDVRGQVLRLGPAPYLRDDQLDDALAALAETAAELATPSGHS